VLRLAILDDASEGAQRHHWRAFLKRLGELGYAEGRSLTVDARYAGGAPERLPALAAELAALKPDIVVARATPAARAARQAAAGIPIVFVAVADPVGSGLVASIAHPGGNVTGLSIISAQMGVKWIELLRELVPGATRLAYLGDPSNPASRAVFDQMQDRARSLKVAIQMLDARQRKELDRTFEAMVADRCQGFCVGTSTVMLDNRDRILQFAARQKLPAVYPRREYVESGGLLYYGVDLGGMYVRLADYVQRIARGAKPSELPVESPSIVRMAVNLKTARAQGIKIPKSILVRADEVIE
jgi:putative ABC transport system substrate-binding protein